MSETKKEIIARLQKDILQWEGFVPMVSGNVKGIGLGLLEEAFPNGVFPTGVIHEMLCPTPEHKAATSGFMAGILASLMRNSGMSIWISTRRQIFPSALMAFNVPPDRVIFIDVRNEKEVLWVMEEALKCEGVAAVVAEIDEVSFAQSRRLQLAVESSRATGFLLRSDGKKLSTTTCVARWQVACLPSQTPDDLPGIGYPRWQVDLLRVRNGNPGTWQIEWLAGNFNLVVSNEQISVLDERKAG